MKTLKRFFAVVLTAALLISTQAFAVSAESIADRAKPGESGKKYSYTFEDGEDGLVYKLELSKKGNIEINFNYQLSTGVIQLFDADGNSIKPDSIDMSSGKSGYWNDTFSYDGNGNKIVSGYATTFTWNEAFEKSAGKLIFKSKSKGIYYAKISYEYGSKGKGKVSWSFSYPSAKKSDSSGSGKISNLTIRLDVGDSVKLGADVSPDDADVTWSSSKSSVASVSESGKITAKKVGTAIITVKCGSSSIKIRVIVE